MILESGRGSALTLKAWAGLTVMLRKKLDAFQPQHQPAGPPLWGKTALCHLMWSGSLNNSGLQFKTPAMQYLLYSSAVQRVKRGKRSNGSTSSCRFYSFGDFEWTQFSSRLLSNMILLQHLGNLFASQSVP